MLRTSLMALALLLASPDLGLTEPTRAMDTAPRIRMTLGAQQVVVRLLDHAASREFLAMLPLTLEFSDFAHAEKIATLPHRLPVEGIATARRVPGDFTYYAPWGNLAVFYKGEGADSQLYTLGHIESGKEILASLNRPFTAVLERLP